MDILSGPQPNHFTRVELSSDEGAEYLANRMNQKNIKIYYIVIEKMMIIIKF